MKYAFLVGDGMADRPVAELGGRTPLEAAATPNMDEVVAKGRLGRVRTVPEGLPPGSDVANMSLLGYDAAAHFQGRGPIEAASLGVALAPNETAFRCNLVTLEGGLMADYSAGHIGTEESRLLVLDLEAALGRPGVRFHPGVSYRHLTVMADFPDGLDCTPPHDISGQPWEPHLPRGAGREAVLELMEGARRVLAGHPVNARRAAAGKKSATDIWLWGQGRALTLATLKERYGLTGSVISAVDLVRGLGVLAGLEVRLVEGATGYLGTNYAGKVAAAKAALETEDFVYLHVEAPDEMGHEGRADRKVQAIEEFDRFVVGEMLRWAEARGDVRVVVATDHETPVAIKTHAAGPVPYAVCGPGIAAGVAKVFNESAAAGLPVESPAAAFDRLIR
jgi:2,3-bisphosphoglycerate-independent phosphoglycerate mutase